MQVAGVILCGGQSRRMGRPKEWLAVGHETILQRTVRILSQVVHPIFVVCSQDQVLPELSIEVIELHDLHPNQGPFGGLLTALNYMPPSVDRFYLSCCDAPLLKPEFVTLMVRSIASHDVVIPDYQGRLHPLAAVYRSTLLPVVQTLFDNGKRRMIDLQEHCDLKAIDQSRWCEADPEAQSLINVNTPEEYEQVLRLLASGADIKEPSLSWNNRPTLVIDLDGNR